MHGKVIKSGCNHIMRPFNYLTMLSRQEDFGGKSNMAFMCQMKGKVPIN